jgi:hypothetical protein
MSAAGSHRTSTTEGIMQPQDQTAKASPENGSGGGSTVFSFGDRVVHAAKPEWGVGVVSKSQNLKADGHRFQSLTIRFERAGLKTLSTAFADIRPADQGAHPSADAADGSGSAPTPAGEGGWLADAASQPPDRAMARLPEACSDPFASLADRLRATIGQYRFEPTGASLLDWAAAQTGLADPLSRFSRHELEQYFERYADNRDTQLRSLAEEMRKQDPASLERALAQAPPRVRNAVNRQHRRR